MCKHVFGDSEQAVHALDGLFALTNAMHRQLLGHLAAFDRDQRWREDGANDASDWYAYRYGASAATARL